MTFEEQMMQVYVNREHGTGVELTRNSDGSVSEFAYIAPTVSEPEMVGLQDAGGDGQVDLMEFSKGIMDTAAYSLKGVSQAFLGAGGDVEHLVRGIAAAAAPDQGEGRWDAFLRGLDQENILPFPDTEKMREVFDKYLPISPVSEMAAQPAPEGSGGVNPIEYMAEFGAPGGQIKATAKAAKVVKKAGDELIKRVSAKEIPKLFSHGTSEAAAEGIMASGKFDPSAGARNYSYSEFGRKAVYLTPDGGWWLDPKKSTEGRAVKYDASVISEVDPKAKIFRVDSVGDLEKIARKAGFDSAEKMMISLNVENLDYLNQAKKTSSMSFENFVDDYVAQVREVFSGLDGAKEIKSLDDLNAFREQEGLGGFNMTLDEMKVGYEDAKTFEVRNFADSDKATEQLINAGIDGIYVGPDFNGASVIQGGPAPDQLAMFRPELIKPTGKKSLQQTDSKTTKVIKQEDN